jgi:hypothetical protein
MDEKIWCWDFDRIASCSAIFVAVIALGVAVYEARVTREHQEISVWPRLTLYNTDIAKVRDGYNNFGSYVKNDGIGPALIKKISFKFKGEEHLTLGSVLRKVLPQKKDLILSTDKKVIEVVLPGKEAMLVTTNLTTDERSILYQLRDDVSVEFCYCSLYNSCWSLIDGETKKVNSCI